MAGHPNELFDQISDVIEVQKPRFKKIYANLPGFFTPHSSPSYFVMALSAPVVVPIACFILTALCAIAAAVAAIICIVSLAVAAGAAIAKNVELKDKALSVAAVSGLTAMPVTPFALIMFAVAGLVLIPYTLVSLMTRSGTTVVNGISNGINACCCADEEDPAEPATPNPAN